MRLQESRRSPREGGRRGRRREGESGRRGGSRGGERGESPRRPGSIKVMSGGAGALCGGRKGSAVLLWGHRRLVRTSHFGTLCSPGATLTAHIEPHCAFSIQRRCVQDVVPCFCMLVLRSLGKFAQPCIGHRGQLLARQRQQRAGQRSCVTASAAPTMVYRVEPLTKGERVIPAADVVLEAFSYDDEYSMSRALGASREGFPIWMR